MAASIFTYPPNFNLADFQLIPYEEYKDLIYRKKYLLRKVLGDYKASSPNETVYATDLKHYQPNNIADLGEKISYRICATMIAEPTSTHSRAYIERKKVVWLILNCQLGKPIRISATPLLAYYLFDDDPRYNLVDRNPFPIEMYLTMMVLDDKIVRDSSTQKYILISPVPISSSNTNSNSNAIKMALRMDPIPEKKNTDTKVLLDLSKFKETKSTTISLIENAPSKVKVTKINTPAEKKTNIKNVVIAKNNKSASIVDSEKTNECANAKAEDPQKIEELKIDDEIREWLKKKNSQKAKVKKTNVEKTKVNTPIVDTPIVETLKVETPIVETLIVDTPIVDTPIIENVEETQEEEEESEDEKLEAVPDYDTLSLGSNHNTENEKSDNEVLDCIDDR